MDRMGQKAKHEWGSGTRAIGHTDNATTHAPTLGPPLPWGNPVYRATPALGAGPPPPEILIR